MAERVVSAGIPVFLKCEYTYILGEHTCVKGQSVLKQDSGDLLNDHMMKVRVIRDHIGSSPVRFTEFYCDRISEEEFNRIEEQFARDAENAEVIYKA